MIFTSLPLAGAFRLDLDLRTDARGYFARTFCQGEFRARGLKTEICQSNVSFNPLNGTLRGMHYQADPHAEAKVVACHRGAIFDVLIDLRPGSDTCCQWAGLELSAENGAALYIPEGFAHGFITLQPETLVVYQMFTPYHADSARGVRWDDPAFGIEWPSPGPIHMSDRDRAYRDYQVGQNGDRE